MNGEGRYQDYKLTYDTTDSSAPTKQVKTIVALLNAGGGRLIYGRNEIESPGVGPELLNHLDSARIADSVERFVSPNKIDLSHNIQELENGNVIVTIEIPAAEYPLVMSRDGTWSGFDSRNSRPLFRKGDVWTRHGSRTEPITYEDLRLWIENAKRSERDKIMERLTTYVNLPEGTTLQPVSSSGLPIDSPIRLIENSLLRREHDSDHLLTANDLLWIFRQRESLTLILEHLDLLLASSLRRSATLFWWLTDGHINRDMIVEELNAVFAASDRDRSDAASSIVDLAALYANDDELGEILHNLEHSRYLHFREAASRWHNREYALEELGDRIISASHEGKHLLDYSENDLEQLATIIASELADSPSAAKSRKLATITRVIWTKKSSRGNELLRDLGVQIRSQLTGA